MTFREFWPLYLQAHSQPATRAVHYVATVIGVGSALAAIATLHLIFFVGIAVGYGLAIGSHAFLEKNRSMIGVNPIWGAIADLRMFWLAASGRLQRETARLNSPGRQSPGREQGTALTRVR